MTIKRERVPHDDAGSIRTRLSRIDGEAGELWISGYRVQEIAGLITYEEAVYLLWEGSLPDADQLAGLHHALCERRSLPPVIFDVLYAAASQGLAPTETLRSAASLLDLRPRRTSREDTSQVREDALAVVAVFPTIIAAYARILSGQEPIPPRSDLGYAANYLYMMDGQEASRERIQALETYLVTVCEHGVSASTFAARVIVSTGSDLLSAIVGAVGALKGPLHGGAPGPILDMLQHISMETGGSDRAASFLRTKLERGERLMGFGHRDYKVRDPRAAILESAAECLASQQGNKGIYEIGKRVETAALRLLDEYKPGRRLDTNLEFWVAVLLNGIGLRSSLFTPTFAAARTAGWAAHCLEQIEVGRMLQPQSVSEDERNLQWIPITDR